MFSIMLFIFLCFFGILAVLYHMLRSREKNFANPCTNMPKCA